MRWLLIAGLMKGAHPAAVIGEIQSAFSSTEYPGDERLIGSADGEPEMASFFQVPRWDAVPEHVLDSYGADLWRFTPEAMLFFLPAFLIAAIRTYDEGRLLPDMVVFALTRPDREREPERHGRFMAWAGALSPAQHAAIRGFLEYLQDAYPAEHALEGNVPEEDMPDTELALRRYWRSNPGK